jgi:hypothetical protein
MQDEVFSLNSVLKYLGLSYLNFKRPTGSSEPDRAEAIEGLHQQIIV